jgi:hypothetical protein
VTLQSPHLDDLTWDALMEATRRRIPAESGGLWTLHAPSDPGVTLLELFAYLLEQRLYWLDQVPDALVVAVLRLLGLAPPLPARSAATVLELASDSPTVVPAGTVLSRDPLQRITFTLDSDVAVVPVEDLTLVAGGRDRTGDLLARRGVPLLRADGGADEFEVALRAAGAPSGAWLSLLFDLDAPAECPPSWSPDAVDHVPPPAALSWSFNGEPAEVVDATAGLRRSGVVRLRLPDRWPAGGLTLRVHTDAATYSAPPVLLQLAPNAGTARHRETRTVTGADLADRLANWLRLPAQRLSLPDARGLLLDASVRISRDGEVAEWTAMPDFTFGGPADRVFVVDRDEGAVRFGDGLTGAIPVPDEDGVSVEYVLGGGVAGNGGQTANWFAVDLAGVTARNLVPAADGRDPETIAEARLRAADELGRVHRAVTAADYADLAASTPGVAVARAYVGVGEHPGYPCDTVPGAVTVRVLPAAGTQPDPGLLDAVRAHLERARLVGTELFVCRPRYRRTRLRVDLTGRAGAETLRAALRRYLDPLVGGDDGDGWPFGGPLRPSALLRVAQDAAGDTADVSAVAIGLDGAEPAESCADVPLRPGELPALDTVDIREVRP